MAWRSEVEGYILKAFDLPGLTAATGFEIDWANNLYHDERVG